MYNFLCQNVLFFSIYINNKKNSSILRQTSQKQKRKQIVRFIKILNYIKWLYIHKNFQVSKVLNTSILYTLKALLSKIGSISSFSSSDMQKFYYPLGCLAIGINSSFNSFLSLLCFSNLICLTKNFSQLD